MKKFVIYICIGLFSSFSWLQAQCDLLDRLLTHDFENIQIVNTPSGLEVHYENRRYRFEADALYHVLREVRLSNCLSDQIAVVIYNKGVPVSEVVTTKTELDELYSQNKPYSLWAKEARFNFTKRKRPKEGGPTNRSYLKSDLATGFKIDYLLGNFDNPIRWTPTLTPTLQSTLFKGMTLNSRYHVVLFDDLYGWEVSRLHSAYLSYNAKLPLGIFARVSGGYFFNTQFGYEAHLTKLFMQDRFRLDISASNTENRFITTPPTRKILVADHFSYTAKLTYRYRPFMTDISLQYGKYLFDDTGYTLFVSRQFDEVFIGFFMRDTDKTLIGSFGKEYEVNYGFFFKTPLGTKKHFKTGKPGNIRLKTQEQFFLDYNYTGITDTATLLEVPNTIIHELWEYYPSTLEKGLASHFK